MLKKVFSSILFSLVFFNPSFSESIEKECIEKINGEKVKVVYFHEEISENPIVKREIYGESPIYRKIIDYYRDGQENILYFCTLNEQAVTPESFDSFIHNSSIGIKTSHFKKLCDDFSLFQYDFMNNSDNVNSILEIQKKGQSKVRIEKFFNREDGLVKRVYSFNEYGKKIKSFQEYEDNIDGLQYKEILYDENADEKSIYEYYMSNPKGIISCFKEELPTNIYKATFILDPRMSENHSTKKICFFGYDGKISEEFIYYEKELRGGFIYMAHALYQNDGNVVEIELFDKALKSYGKKVFK